MQNFLFLSCSLLHAAGARSSMMLLRYKRCGGLILYPFVYEASWC